jgi:hypothetical protein
LSELLADLGVIAEIELCANKNDGNARRMVLNLGIPL